MDCSGKIVNAILANDKHDYPQLSLRLIKQSSKCSIEVEEIAGGCPFFPKFFWFQAVAKSNEIEMRTTGESFSRHKGLLRAIGEGVERVCMSTDTVWTELLSGHSLEQNVPSSNGVSFHTSLQSAVRSAYLEVLERHVVLECWINKSCCFEFGFRPSSSLLNKLNGLRNGVTVRLLSLPNNYATHVVVCVLCGKKAKSRAFGFIYGFGCEPTLEKAIEKATVEAWRFYWHRETQESDARKDENDNKPGPIDHYYHHLEEARELSLEVAKGTPRTQNYDEPDFLERFESLEPSVRFFDTTSVIGIGGYCVQVSHESLHSLWFGGLKEPLGQREIGEFHPVP